MKARARKIPPPHQLAFVNKFPACRVPKIVPEELLAPPKDAAIPPPCPACIRTTAIRTKLSMPRRTRRNVYIGYRVGGTACPSEARSKPQMRSALSEARCNPQISRHLASWVKPDKCAPSSPDPCWPRRRADRKCRAWREEQLRFPR